MSRVRLAQLCIEEGHPSVGEGIAREAVEQFRQEKLLGNEAEATAVVAQSLAGEQKLDEAIGEVDRATALAANSENAELHLTVGLIAGQVHAAAGQCAEATKLLHATLSDATAAGFVGYELEARLALAQVAIESGAAAAHRGRLRDLEKEASAKGFLVIARKAAALN